MKTDIERIVIEAQARQRELEALVGALRSIDPAVRPEAAKKLMHMAADAVEQLIGKEGP